MRNREREEAQRKKDERLTGRKRSFNDVYGREEALHRNQRRRR